MSIEQLRAKLIDLSLRNKLLTLRLARGSSISVIDELPEQVFEALRDGKAFTFEPLPDPQQATLEEFWSEHGPPPDRRTKPEEAAWARFNGIPTNLDLAEPSGVPARPHHNDLKLRTLLFRDTLEARVRKLGSDARSAIEETGSNMLFMGFGFLEWVDERPGASADTTKAHLAPLVLLPVQLQRVANRIGPRAYELSWNGEDIQDNLALKQKMRVDYDLKLPDFDPDASLTDYFKAVAKAVETKPGWRVRRQVYLSLISQLGKLLLYNDLDPQNWFAGKGIEQHPLVGSLLGAMGQDAGGGVSYEDPERIDPATFDQELTLPLVDRCDSSQLEAVRLVLSGANLVIQGPPGTGKSQTITNIIAAALSLGKSVLFVAEKLAAIEVVKRRLDSMELGDYCLELHSNRTRKNSFLAAIEERLNRRRPSGAAGLKDKLDRLKARRDALRRYVDTIRKPAMNGKAVADVLYAAGRSQLGLGAHSPQLIELGLPARAAEALKESPPPGGDFTSRLASFGERIAQMRERGARFDVWRGVKALNLLQDDVPDIRTKLATWRSALNALTSAGEGAYAAAGLGKAPTMRGVRALAQSVTSLKTLEAAAPACREGDRAIADAFALIGLPLKRGGRRGLALIEAINAALTAAPATSMHLRHSGLFLDGAAATAKELAAETEALKTLRAEIDACLPGARKQQLDEAQIRPAIHALRHTNVIARLFSAEWKSAMALIIAMGGDTRRTRPAVLADTLEMLLSFDDRSRRLFGDHRFPLIAGDRANGLETPMSDLARLTAWIEMTRRALSRHGAEASQALFVLAPETMAAFSERYGDDMFNAVRTIIQTHHEAWTDGETLVAELAVAAAPKGMAKHAERWIEADALGRVAEAAERLFDPLARNQAAENALAQHLGLDLNEADLPDEIPARAARAAAMEAALPSLLEWVGYARARAELSIPAAAPLIVEAEEGRLPTPLLPSAWEFVRDRAIARNLFQSEPALHAVSGLQLASDRDDFRRLDEEVMELRRTEIAQRQHQRQAPIGRPGPRVGDMTELSLIKHQIGLQRRHRPIRDLMKRSGKAIQALKPCFMMGPMSVAQYLAPGYLEFDLVIMDEASQLRPEDAIGAIARGKQAIIVGDDMQLPPTSFFDRIDDGDDQDEDEIVIGQREESVLRLAAQRFQSRMLAWHYRSQDEALIAFSNWKFYNSRLILFPAPKHGDGRTGIEFNFVAGGTFSQGVNEAEARAIAEAAVAHVRTHPTRSAIVVAMNIRQRDRIRYHVDELMRGEPLLIAEEDASVRIEPFDVKNLENVQGDERDVVFISMTYGPDPGSKRVLQRFGPINGEYGHRRLNVLFSRARQKMVVFSSMRHGDIILTENSALGVQALRDFLFYAETRQLRLDATPVGSGRPPDSDFEVAVAQALAAQGYECVAQLGVAGFFLDIAVRNPDNPESFLLGIECDGASYHSTQSARDRDRLRQDVLESLGWRIERVWSTDWFTDPSAEVRRLTASVERARVMQAMRPEKEDAVRVTPAVPEAQSDARENVNGAADSLTKEEARQLLIALRDREIYQQWPDADRTRGLLRQSMLDVLLRTRPQTFDDYDARIAIALREKTDAEQVRTYGDRVFSILARTRD